LKVAGLPNEAARESISRLVGSRWLDPLDAAGSRFRFTAGQLADTLFEEHQEELFRRRHAEALLQLFNHVRTQPQLCRELLAELEMSFDWAVEADWSLATILGRKAFYFLKDGQRLSKRVQFTTGCDRTLFVAATTTTVEECDYELSWLREGMTGYEIPCRPRSNSSCFKFGFLPLARYQCDAANEEYRAGDGRQRNGVLFFPRGMNRTQVNYFLSRRIRETTPCEANNAQHD